MLNRALNIVTIALFAGGLGINLIFGGCDMPVPTLTGSVPMKCVWGSTAASIVLSVGLILSCARLVLKTTEAKRFAAFGLGLIALAVALIPSSLGVGVCSWDGSALCCSHLVEAGASAEEIAWCGLAMDCHISAIALWIMAILVVISVSIQAATASSNGSQGNDPVRPKLYD